MNFQGSHTRKSIHLLINSKSAIDQSTENTVLPCVHSPFPRPFYSHQKDSGQFLLLYADQQSSHDIALGKAMV